MQTKTYPQHSLKKRAHLIGVLLFSASAMFANTGCTPKRNSTLEFLGGEDVPVGIFSNRPQNKEQFIAVLKLKEAPGLASITKDEQGNRIVDPTALKNINGEQESVIQSLKALSPDIRVLYRYKMILNGLTILAPTKLESKIRALGGVSYVESAGEFARPIIIADAHPGSGGKISDLTSVNFIGADKVHKLGFTGKGMKVGIIDTGIDFTHSMLGGPGSEDAFKNTKPDQPSSLFPNAKVLGGIDLVGTEYNAASPNFALHVPKPDENPLDEGGHGSHVAGTVAGIGDGTNTYSGVAPDADLFAIKVFGAEGSTSDPVVVAALEYAADPNKDGKLSDQLDVVNMSLGSSWGNPHILYSEAIKNLSEGGTVVVASAGNSGHIDYIVGAPSVSEEAISVAASVDHSPHNWKFQAVKFLTATQGEKLVEAVESSIAKPIAEAGDVTGKLVHIGLANKDLSDEQKAKLKGNVALIDRGQVTFAEKLKRAEAAGAIGVVVANNQPGNPFTMGGDGKIAIPAIMISRDLGDLLKKDLEAGVTLQFNTPDKIEKPNLIDTLTDFSSKGPRSLDALLKPEISAPGANVISAAMGSGNQGVKFSGTSMAGPHIAGVMALLKQSHPNLTSKELKSLLMGQAKSIQDENGKTYSLAEQGSGRVQTDKSASAQLIADQVALSLGEVGLITKKTVRFKALVTNLSSEDSLLLVRLTGDPALSMPSQSVTIPANSKKSVSLNLTLDASSISETVKEIDGVVEFVSGDVKLRLPTLAIVKKLANISGDKLALAAGSEEESAGAAATVSLTNTSKHDGEALAFNLLGTSTRKPNQKNDQSVSRACDLQSVGYRVVDKNLNGAPAKVLQVVGKLYEAMTTWHSCELSVLIDTDGDQLPEQELALVNADNIPGMASPGTSGKFFSVLLNATIARKIRADFENDLKDPNKKPEESYQEAILSVEPGQLFNNSTLVLAEAPIDLLARREGGELAVKVATIHNESSAAQMDDFMNKDDWKTISLIESVQPYSGMPEKQTIKAGSSEILELTKGESPGDLLLLFPRNRSVVSDVMTDSQSQILKPEFNSVH